VVQPLARVTRMAETLDSGPASPTFMTMARPGRGAEPAHNAAAQAFRALHLVQPVTMLTITAMLPGGRDWHQIKAIGPGGHGGAVTGTGDAHGRNACQRPGIARRHRHGPPCRGVAPAHNATAQALRALHLVQPVTVLTITAPLPSGRD